MLWLSLIHISSVPYQSETMYLQTAMAILAGVGVTAFFSLLSLMSKRKALLYDTDAFYFFSGPYTKTQTNLFILVQTLKGALGYGLIGCFFTGLLSMGRYFSIPYFLLCLLVFFLISAVFLLMTDYIYTVSYTHLVLEELGFSEKRESAVMIGDRHHDVSGAKTAGISCIGVTYGYGDFQELQQAGAVNIVDSTRELGELFGV